MGVALTTYDTLDDPPSSNRFCVKGIQGFREDLFSCSTRVTLGLFQLLTYESTLPRVSGFSMTFLTTKATTKHQSNCVPQSCGLCSLKIEPMAKHKSPKIHMTAWSFLRKLLVNNLQHREGKGPWKVLHRLCLTAMPPLHYGILQLHRGSWDVRVHRSDRSWSCTSAYAPSRC